MGWSGRRKGLKLSKNNSNLITKFDKMKNLILIIAFLGAFLTVNAQFSKIDPGETPTKVMEISAISVLGGSDTSTVVFSTPYVTDWSLIVTITKNVTSDSAYALVYGALDGANFVFTDSLYIVDVTNAAFSIEKTGSDWKYYNMKIIFYKGTYEDTVTLKALYYRPLSITESR